jgi:TRAP-type transport system periplasmic protein
MFKVRRRYAGLAAAAAALVLGATAVDAKTYKLEISLETSPNHVRNISVTEYAEELMKRSGGKLEVKIYHGAAKYKDTDVPKALNQGAIDMGLPLTLHLGKFVHDFDAPDLPVFYGRSREEVYKVWDGPAGKKVVAELEKKLGVKVVGRWMDLGPAQTFSIGKEFKTAADFKALKIRVPGGAANNMRYEVLGANPVKIAWPDVPEALQRKTVDGLFTTYESVRSAKLWDSGVKFAYENNQNFQQYVPVVSGRSWKAYPKEIQDLIVTVWNEKIDAIRDNAAARQKSAKEDGTKNGIKVNIPSKEDIDASRSKLMAKQNDIVKELQIDPALVKTIMATLGGA